MSGEEKHINSAEIAELISQCVSQHPLAQRRLYEKYYAYVKVICLRYTSRIEDCEEVMDDAFIKVFRHIEKYDFNKPFNAWLRTIVVNTAIDFYRQSIRLAVSDHLEDHSYVSIEDHTLSCLSAEDILKAVQKLSPGYRAVFVMFAIDGFNHKEIAEALNITEGTSKSNLAKARVKLQEILKGMYGNEYSPEFYKYNVSNGI